jgi:predicted transcriptional regulator
MDELEVRLVLSEEEPMSVEAIAEERGLDRSHVEEQLRNDSSAMISW